METSQAIEKQLKQSHVQYEKVVQQNRDLQAELQPFRDKWFAGLDTKSIAQLAKKSVLMTSDWLNAEAFIDHIEETVQNASPENAVRIIKQSIEEYRKENGGAKCK